MMPNPLRGTTASIASGPKADRAGMYIAGGFLQTRDSVSAVPTHRPPLGHRWLPGRVSADTGGRLEPDRTPAPLLERRTAHTHWGESFLSP